MQAENLSGNANAVWIAPNPPIESPAISVSSRDPQYPKVFLIYSGNSSPT